jgi:ABC-type Na+ efflux pump permease subunit
VRKKPVSGTHILIGKWLAIGAVAVAALVLIIVAIFVNAPLAAVVIALIAVGLGAYLGIWVAGRYWKSRM